MMALEPPDPPDPDDVEPEPPDGDLAGGADRVGGADRTGCDCGNDGMAVAGPDDEVVVEPDDGGGVASDVVRGMAWAAAAAGRASAVVMASK